LYFSLGGSKYIFHHCLSGVSVAYYLFFGEDQLYTYMVLIFEVTTSEINLRGYFDISGLKQSEAYLINEVAIFLTWKTARIILCSYMFYHIYKNYQITKILASFFQNQTSVVSIALSVMNLMSFGKTVKRLMITLEKDSEDTIFL
ncbi:hypothetical protein F2Q70_00002999, partial [Brassica cretica]